MGILQRYFFRRLFGAWLLVLMVLGAVFGLLGFVQELERGTPHYDVFAMMQYTLLTLPQRILELAPVVALLGTGIALVSMEKANELNVLRGSGMSLRRFLGKLAIPTFALMLLLWTGFEFVTVPLHQHGEQLRYAQRNYNSDVIPKGGVWAKNGKRYVHLGKMFDDYVPGDIDLYEFNDDGTLARALHAEKAIVHPDRRWIFKDVRIKERLEGELTTSHAAETEIGNLWTPQELPTLTLAFKSMTLETLFHYGEYLRTNGLAHQQYLSAFWQRLAMPLAVAAMVLLAVPISLSLGSGRSASFGIKMGVGAAVGIFFYLGSQIVFALGLLLDLNIPIVSLVPTLVVATSAIVMLPRLRW